MKFCCNALCQFHLEAGDNNRLDWEIGTKHVQVRQLTVIDSATGASLRFCEVCANAVAMANEATKNNENRKEEKSSGG